MMRTSLPRSRGTRRLWASLICALLAALPAGAPWTVVPSGAAPAWAAAIAAPATLRLWYATDDPTEGPLAQALAARFQDTHPGVKVRLTTYALDDMNTKLQLALSAGTPPDLVYTTPRGPGLPAYVRAGKLLDLTAVAARGGWASHLRPGLLASYNDLLTPGGRAHGHVYAAPTVLAVVGVLYNRAIFSRLHLAIPHSLAQLDALCARVQRAGLTPLGFGNADGWVGDDWYLTLVNALAGPAALRPEQQLDPHFSFGGAAFHTAGAMLQRWATHGYFTPDFGGLDAQDSVAAFFAGRTAMQLVSSTQNGQIVSLARQTRTPIGLFAFPGAAVRTPPVMPQSGYEGWAVPRASHQPALAAAFITQVLDDETVQALLAHGLLPARRLDRARVDRAPGFQRAYLQALDGAAPGVYLDGAPVPNLNATMEANVQLLLQQYETPAFLTRSLQMVYDSHGARASSTRTDGEF